MLALFWFLRYHECATGQPFEFTYQNELADAAGISPSTLSELKDTNAHWLNLTNKAAAIRK